MIWIVNLAVKWGEMGLVCVAAGRWRQRPWIAYNAGAALGLDGDGGGEAPQVDNLHTSFSRGICRGITTAVGFRRRRRPRRRPPSGVSHSQLSI